MSNYPVIEQSTCSAVINYAILYFCKTYWELGKQQQSHKDLPSGTSQHPDISGAGVRTGQCPKGCHVWQEARPPWVASFWIRAAPFLGFYWAYILPLWTPRCHRLDSKIQTSVHFRKREREGHMRICRHASSHVRLQDPDTWCRVPTKVAPRRVIDIRWQGAPVIYAR